LFITPSSANWLKTLLVSRLAQVLYLHVVRFLLYTILVSLVYHKIYHTVFFFFCLLISKASRFKTQSLVVFLDHGVIVVFVRAGLDWVFGISLLNILVVEKRTWMGTGGRLSIIVKAGFVPVSPK